MDVQNTKHEAETVASSAGSNGIANPASEQSIPFNALKDRIRHHYEVCSDYYYSLWGEHIHHGYFLSPSDTKAEAEIQLIDLLLERSELPKGSIVLDVGCGIGGTTRRLARHHECIVVGITISSRQVEIAQKLTLEEAEGAVADADGFVKLGDGKVHFIELDAEKMGDFFMTEPNKAKFDCVWILEAMSHLPNKELFFRNTELLLKHGGTLVVADSFKAEGLSSEQMDADIKPLEVMLPPLCSQEECVGFAEGAGLVVSSNPFDISDKVSRTWDFSWSFILSSARRAFAVARGRVGLAILRVFGAMRRGSSGLAFLEALRAMRRGYANGNFRYAVIAFQKK